MSTHEPRCRVHKQQTPESTGNECPHEWWPPDRTEPTQAQMQSGAKGCEQRWTSANRRDMKEEVHVGEVWVQVDDGDAWQGWPTTNWEHARLNECKQWLTGTNQGHVRSNECEQAPRSSRAVQFGVNTAHVLHLATDPNWTHQWEHQDHSRQVFSELARIWELGPKLSPVDSWLGLNIY